ncbi:hypothetical protein JCM10207_002607 [Rhodosporidiobolus poonsookiae]
MPPKPTRKPSPLATGYLVLYNTTAALAWGYVLSRVVRHMLGGDGYTGLKEWVGAQGALETLEKRATSGFDEFGDVVKWVQTAALLEAVHSALRLVRSPLGTTVAQIASRLALVWGVCVLFPEVPRSPFYISMVTAWSLAEIIRYTHYATGLLGLKLGALEWLRYTAFYILYPVGAGSEAVLIAKSAPYAKEQYGLLASIAVYVLVSGWPPALFFLMSYMHSQRRKHLRHSPSLTSASLSPSSPLNAATTTPPKKAPRDITSAVGVENIIQASGADTPARSTRSRTKRAQPTTPREELQLEPVQHQPPAIQLPDPPRRSRRHSHHRSSSSSHHHSKPKRPPPAQPADGSQPTPTPRKPALPQDGSVKVCEAVDRYEDRCDEVVVGGWKGKVRRRWCQMHDDEEKHVRGSFWNAVSSLPRLSRTSPLPSPQQITSSTSFTELEAWEQIARQHIQLATRAHEAWTFHREHFWAAGGDLVDRLEGRGEAEGGGDLAKGAWEEVRLRGEKAEAVLKLIIRRSHFLVCDAEDALWLLHPQGGCGHYHGCGLDGSHGSDATGSSCGEGGEHCGCEHDHEHEDDSTCCSACSSHRSHHHHCCGASDHSSQTSSFSSPHHHSHGGHQHHHHGGTGGDADEPPPHNPLRPPGSPTLAPEAEEPDPLVALDTLRRTELLEMLSLTGSHASFIREGRKSVERVRIVECLFRRLIARDEELLVKAYRGGHDHVLRFFEDPALVSLPALLRLHRNLQRTSPVQLKEAIMDAFRAIAWEESGATETEEGDEGVGMQVLGGWVYKNQLERSMTPREWGHLYDLCACPGCATRCCLRFTDLTLIRRLSVVPHGPHPPPFALWAEDDEPDAHAVFKALDVVWCAGKEVDDSGKPERMRQAGEGGRDQALWALSEERNWAFLKLSLTHPHALSILTLLSQFFTLLVRSRLTPNHALPSFPLPPPTHLWTHRIRTGPSKAAILRPSPSSASATWRALPNPFNLALTPAHTLAGFDALDSPEKEQDLAPFPDGTYELLVLDAPSDSPYATCDAYLTRPLSAFENFLAAVVAQGVGIKVPASITPLPGKNGENGGGGVDVQPAMAALRQQALEHGAVESYLAGDLVWDFGDVKGVTTPFTGPAGAGRKFGGVDLKKVGKDGIVAPPLPAPGQANGAAPGGGVGGKKLTNGAGAAAGRKGSKAGAGGVTGTAQERKDKVLDGLRDDRLALRLSRSLFK